MKMKKLLMNAGVHEYYKIMKLDGKCMPKFSSQVSMYSINIVMRQHIM
jgi:hypothetical protein